MGGFSFKRTQRYKNLATGRDGLSWLDACCLEEGAGYII